MCSTAHVTLYGSKGAMHTTTTWVHYMGVTLPLHVEPVFHQLWLLIWLNFCTSFHLEQKHVTPCNNLLTIIA